MKHLYVHKSMSNSQLAKITHILSLRKTKMSNLCGVGKCAEKIPQKVKWDIPNGVLGYEKTGFRASEQGYRGGVLGVQGLRNGGAEAS